MNNSSRVPAFAPYMDRDREKELFETNSTPRSAAIDEAITESVECWLSGDMDGALESANEADKYLSMTDEGFVESADQGE